MNIFERAARGKLRFQSSVGDLTTEQVWDLPLTAAKSGRPDLDGLARAVHSELKAMDEVSFVVAKPDPRKTDLELKLDILKHVIAAKLAAVAAAEKAAASAERKRNLLDALANKEQAELAGMSKEQIVAELSALEA